jgi:hypothetical protein
LTVTVDDPASGSDPAQTLHALEVDHGVIETAIAYTDEWARFDVVESVTPDSHAISVGAVVGIRNAVDSAKKRRSNQS